MSEFDILVGLAMLAMLVTMAVIAISAFKQRAEDVAEELESVQVEPAPQGDGTPGAAPKTQDAPSPAPDVAEPREPIQMPWEMLGFGAVTLLVAGGAVGGGTVMNRRRREYGAVRAARTAKWEQAQGTHAEIANAYADLRLDPVAAIDHMALWDVTDPITAKFTETYGKASDLGGLGAATVPAADSVVSEYAEAVAAAKIAWDAAVAHAQRRGTECLPAPERANADRARKLLLRSRNAAASEAERALAADRAADLLEGLRKVIMPDEMRFELEATKRLALTARDPAVS